MDSCVDLWSPQLCFYNDLRSTVGLAPAAVVASARPRSQVDPKAVLKFRSFEKVDPLKFKRGPTALA